MGIGLDLSRRYFAEVVAPILAAGMPSLRFAAALIGPGSEVLGYDTARSRDHHWGPRVMIFVEDRRLRTLRPRVSCELAERLPLEFEGYPTNFAAPDPNGVRAPERRTSGPIDHMVEVFSVRSYWRRRLGVDPDEALAADRWLTLAQQRLLELTSGEVFRDDLGEIASARARLSYFPRDVWLYLLASQWRRIGQEEAFLGRNHELGDELGARLVAARLVRDLMKLTFLQDRRYWAYSKWFAAAFRRLSNGPALAPRLQAALAAATAHEREQALVAAWEMAARRHNTLSITAAIEPAVRPFFDRPYLVIGADRFAAAIRAEIADPWLKARPLIGSIDQFGDSTDLTESPPATRRLERLYGRR